MVFAYPLDKVEAEVMTWGFAEGAHHNSDLQVASKCLVFALEASMCALLLSLFLSSLLGNFAGSIQPWRLEMDLTTKMSLNLCPRSCFGPEIMRPFFTSLVLEAEVMARKYDRPSCIPFGDGVTYAYSTA